MCARICPSQLISLSGVKLPGAKQKVPYTYVHEHYYCSLCGLCVEVCPTTALEYSREYRLTGFRREDAVIDHLTLLQERQQAAGLPVTPIPTAAEIAAAEAAEAAAREAREKEAAVKAAKAAKPVEAPEKSKSPKAPPEPEEVKE
jgi:formate hydrogenlyase subunit 6/NADH:ubiquinone oxidoreductase subunit I